MKVPALLLVDKGLEEPVNRSSMFIGDKFCVRRFRTADQSQIRLLNCLFRSIHWQRKQV